MQSFAQVIVDVSHSQLDRVFEYIVPETLRGQIARGHRVLVPFGRGNAPAEGFVIALSDTAAYDSAKLKSVLRVMEPYNVLLEDQLELARWMAEKYNANLVDALRLMLPAELRGGRVREKQLRTWRLLLDETELQPAINSLNSKNGTCKAPLQRDLLLLLAQFGEMSVAEAHEQIKGADSAARACIKKGWIEVRAHEAFRRPYDAVTNEPGPAVSATEDQRASITRVCGAMDADGGRFILRGVTGSGKTEVYLRCMSHCISLGKSAIMLVPEISLTPQTVERFRARFGSAVAVLHSRLSAGERYDEWRRIRLGEVKVAVGARSAVFAPFEKLGLIVIDEEHENSYQSEHTPRYAAADVAQRRCEQHGAVLLLGSATPSLETWHRAKAGEFDILTLDKRINNRPLPEVEIVDMRAELAQGNKSMFSAALYRQMRECFFAQKQMILFLNRRGYSTFVSCRGCGYVLKCGQCDVSMTYHKTDGTVRCHYCGAQRHIPERCPQCSQPYLKHFGVGTQQVEEQVLRLFPGIRVLRMDYDTTQKKDAHLTLLQAFRDQQADVLVGTQMIAKGLDFPQVTLVGVIAADATLFVPDFRSAERAFSLITQVAGRAGRDADAGRVVVQTYSPEHPSIQCSARHDFEAFYEYEIECRRQSEFPPFADFVRFLFVGENDAQLAQACKAFQEELLADLEEFIARNALDRKSLLYVSAHAAPLHFLRGQYRHQAVLKLLRNENSAPILSRITAFARNKRKQGFLPSMEINPQNMV